MKEVSMKHIEKKYEKFHKGAVVEKQPKKSNW